MEFILEVIVEALVQFLFEGLISLGFESLVEAFIEQREPNRLASIVGLLMIGAFLGLISVWIFPKQIIPGIRITGFSIIFSPLCAGLMLQIFGDWRRRHGNYPSYLASFWGGASFAFALSFVRWLIIRG